MSNLVFTANGRSGSVELFDNYLIVKKKMNILKRLTGSGEKEIFLDNIKNIKFNVAKSLVYGFIQFETAQNSKELGSNGLMNTPNDDYTINFTKAQQSQFDKLKSEINRLRSGSSSKSETVSQNTSSDADELEKLANLLEKGILTQDEFNQKKKQILSL